RTNIPTLIDGGVDWEGVYWSAGGPNILIDLPVALRNWEPYVASGFSRQSAAFQAMLNAGYPPDIFARPPTPGNTFSPVFGSHWETHANNYWDVTTCVFVRELDPLYPMSQLDPLGRSDTKDYDYAARRKPFHLAPRIGQILVDWVERGVLPPPSQCVPRGGTIVPNPGAAGQPERCAALLEE